MNYLNYLIKKYSQKYKGLQLSFIVEQSDYDKMIKQEIVNNKWYREILTIGTKSKNSPLSIADYIAGVYKDWIKIFKEKPLQIKSEEEIRKIKNRIIKNFYDKIKTKIRHSYLEREEIHISRESRVKYKVGGGKSLGHELMSDPARSFQFYLTSSAYTKIPFEKITSIEILAKWLSVPISFLNKIKSKGITEEYYEKILIPKKNNYEKREVYHVVETNLKNAHKIIEESLKELQPLLLETSVHGFIKKRSIATNAKNHLNKKFIFNLDIKDFFKSTSDKQINKFFDFLGMPKNISKIFTKITTVNGYLVEGFNTSPALANFAFRKIDILLNKIALKNTLTYTRYADDLTFSGNKPIKILSEVEKILNANNFIINQNKIRYFKKGGPMYVTGLTVCDDQIPRITRKYKNRIRMTLFNFNKKIEIAKNEEDIELIKLELGSLKGKIRFINGIEKLRANKYMFELNKIEDNLETKEKEIFSNY